MNRGAYFRLLLDKCGYPVTEPHVFAMCCWAWCEDSGGSNTKPGAGAPFDPLDMENREPGSASWNSAGVQGYPTMTAAVAAFKEAMASGYYDDIRSWLAMANSPASALGTCRSLDTWGTGRQAVDEAIADLAPSKVLVPEVAGAPTKGPTVAGVVGAAGLALRDGPAVFTVTVRGAPEGATYAVRINRRP